MARTGGVTLNRYSGRIHNSPLFWGSPPSYQLWFVPGKGNGVKQLTRFHPIAKQQPIVARFVLEQANIDGPHPPNLQRAAIDCLTSTTYGTEYLRYCRAKNTRAWVRSRSDLTVLPLFFPQSRNPGRRSVAMSPFRSVAHPSPIGTGAKTAFRPRKSWLA